MSLLFRSMALFVFILLTHTSIYAQKDGSSDYITWVYTIDLSIGDTNNLKKLEIKGYLKDIKDSSIFLSQMPWAQTYEINAQNINVLKFRKKHRMTRSILVGSLTGFASGFLFGYIKNKSSCDNCSFSEHPLTRASIDGLLFAVPGGLGGMAIGLIKIKIPIVGNIDTFGKKRKDLDVYKLKL